ncbi:hypothetical protein A0256_19220 [Mucilaginibacter sp. PAMC 26640]|nr:hypothetical protein A0256_19220 [Mucilaginibacter sp. PAMC 26640]
MKYKACLALLVITTLSACKKEAVTTDYDKSYSAWQLFRKSVNNSYSYVTYGGSVFGYYSESKITVQNGRITSRDFVARNFKPGTDSLVVIASWEESGNTLNTHGNASYFFTLDDIYQQAKNVWLNVDANKNDVYFTVDDLGLITSAGSVEKGCQDDCFNGIRIKDIKVFVKEIK